MVFSRSRLLGSLVFAAFLVAALPGVARADFINVISQSYHIHGFGFGLFDGSQIQTVDYSQTSASTLSRSDNVTVNNPVSGVPIGLFFITTSATGGVTGTSAFVEVFRSKDDLGNAFAINADATAAITFKPLVTQLLIQTERELSWGKGFSGLYDETAGAAVLEFGPFVSPGEYSVPVDLSHTYTIRTSYDGFFDPGTNGARLRITSVPESESIATFLLLGLGALGYSQRSRLHRLWKSR